ncbi:MAG: hypothetical protein AAFQ94_21135 [Bacteroidota bacterium]
MNSKRVYQIGFLSLIVINSILLYLLFVQSGRPARRPGPPRGSVIEKISTRLELTPDQEKAYRQMAQNHGDQMRNFDETHKALITAYFKSFGDDPISSDSIKNEILKIESAKLQHNFDHFTDLKSLLNEKQKNRFGLIMDDILTVLANNRRNRQPPPRD